MRRSIQATNPNLTIGIISVDVQFDSKETVQIYMLFIEESGNCLPMRWLGDLSKFCFKDKILFWVRKRGTRTRLIYRRVSMPIEILNFTYPVVLK